MATIVMERAVECSPEAAVRAIYRAFGAERAGDVTRTLSVPLELLGLPNIGTLAREVVVTLGEFERKSLLVRIPLSWRVPDSTAFPVFHGFIEVQPLASWQIHLSILGYYQPPFGTVGAIFDAVAGRRIAEATVRHLLEEISRSMEAPEA